MIGQQRKRIGCRIGSGGGDGKGVPSGRTDTRLQIAAAWSGVGGGRGKKGSWRKLWESNTNREWKIKKVDATSVDACKIPKPAKILFARYVWLLCLRLVEFLCSQVSCKIRNPITQENYPGTQLLYLFILNKHNLMHWWYQPWIHMEIYDNYWGSCLGDTQLRHVPLS